MLVYPLLMYSITLWGLTCKSHLDKIKIMQKRILRSIYGAKCAYTYSIYRTWLTKIKRYLQIWNIKIYVILLEWNYSSHASAKSKTCFYTAFTIIFTRQAKKIRFPRHRLRSTSSSVSVTGPEVWNTLSDSIEALPCILQLSLTLRNWLLSLYDA